MSLQVLFSTSATSYDCFLLYLSPCFFSNLYIEALREKFSRSSPYSSRACHLPLTPAPPSAAAEPKICWKKISRSLPVRSGSNKLEVPTLGVKKIAHSCHTPPSCVSHAPVKSCCVLPSHSLSSSLEKLQLSVSNSSTRKDLGSESPDFCRSRGRIVCCSSSSKQNSSSLRPLASLQLQENGLHPFHNTFRIRRQLQQLQQGDDVVQIVQLKCGSTPTPSSNISFTRRSSSVDHKAACPGSNFSVANTAFHLPQELQQLPQHVSHSKTRERSPNISTRRLSAGLTCVARSVSPHRGASSNFRTKQSNFSQYEQAVLTRRQEENAVNRNLKPLPRATAYTASEHRISPVGSRMKKNYPKLHNTTVAAVAPDKPLDSTDPVNECLSAQVSAVTNSISQPAAHSAFEEAYNNISSTVTAESGTSLATRPTPAASNKSKVEDSTRADSGAPSYAIITCNTYSPTREDFSVEDPIALSTTGSNKNPVLARSAGPESRPSRIAMFTNENPASASGTSCTLGGRKRRARSADRSLSQPTLGVFTLRALSLAYGVATGSRVSSALKCTVKDNLKRFVARMEDREKQRGSATLMKRKFSTAPPASVNNLAHS